MAKATDLKFRIDDSRFRTGLSNIVIDLYNYLPTITDGTISGVRALDINDEIPVVVAGESVGYFEFRNIPSQKRYTIVVSGPSIEAQIPESLESIDTGFAYNTTGSDIPWKTGSNESIAHKLGNIADATFDSEVVIISDGTGEAVSSEITVTELNYLEDATANIQDQIDFLATGQATTYTANRALVSDSTGKIDESTITTDELDMLEGVTANIQDQINNLVAGQGATYTPERVVVSDSTGIGVGSSITVAELESLDGIDSNVQDQLDTHTTNITNVRTASSSLVFATNRVMIADSTGLLEVSPITKTELEYLDDSTANIQTQLNLIFNYNTGKSAETIYKSGGSRIFTTVQEALDDAFTNGGNVIVHEKSSVYNEALTLKNNVNVHLEGTATIETNSTSPAMTANGVSCVISGTGKIRQIYSVGGISNVNKFEALKITNSSNVTIQDGVQLYAIGRNSATISGTTIYVQNSVAKILCGIVENDNTYSLLFEAGSSGLVSVKEKIRSYQTPAIRFKGNDTLEIKDTIVVGDTSVNIPLGCITTDSTGDLLITNSRIELTEGDASGSGYALWITSTQIGQIILSGSDFISFEGSGGYPIFNSEVEYPIYVRRQCWGNGRIGTIDDGLGFITVNGSFLTGYGEF